MIKEKFAPFNVTVNPSDEWYSIVHMGKNELDPTVKPFYPSSGKTYRTIMVPDSISRQLRHDDEEIAKLMFKYHNRDDHTEYPIFNVFFAGCHGGHLFSVHSYYRDDKGITLLIHCDNYITRTIFIPFGKHLLIYNFIAMVAANVQPEDEFLGWDPIM